MGNCQAIDAATLVIQHPSGKVDKLYWPVSASEVMKMNPGHYVALLLSTTLYPPNNKTTGECPAATTTTTTNTTTNNNNNSLRITRIKLLRPTDTLVLGHVYRLITTQEVMRGMWAKKQAKLKKSVQQEPAEKPERLKQKHGSGLETEPGRSELVNKKNQEMKRERNVGKTTTSANSAAARSRTWQPSLQSISEAGSGSGSGS